jgi:hypothetical protein
MQMKCRSCRSENLVKILDLGDHPWCNDFLDESGVGEEQAYPLKLIRCRKCTLLQLNFTVPKEVMFGNHDYLSGTSETLRNHFAGVAKKASDYMNLDFRGLVVDIGGNDGTQLKEYQKLGFKRLCNVEPSKKTAKISKSDGIFTVNEFFNEASAEKNFRKNEVSIINAAGVFFHLEELHSVIKGIKYCLSDKGILVIQFGYAGQVLDGGFYDFIYHEHLCLYSLMSLTNLLAPYGLHVRKVEKSEIHNGSLVVFVGKSPPASASDSAEISALLRYESMHFTEEHALGVQEVALQNKNSLKRCLEELNIKGKKVWAYGAPAKGNTLLNYCGIKNNLIEKAVEVNEFKIGKYLPGSHIPIVKESKDSYPDYYLLLTHNLKEEILERNKDLIKLGVKFIIPFPEVEIIG